MEFKIIHEDSSEVNQKDYSGDVNEESNVKVFKVLGNDKEFSVNLEDGIFKANGKEFDPKISGEKSLVYRRRTSILPEGKLVQHVFGFSVDGEVKKVMLVKDDGSEFEYKDSL